jgi:urease beta subunit
MKPGELLLAEAPVRINAGKPTVELEVENTSDHTVFISSHFPFFEVNRRLAFDRAQAWGMHLDVPAGDTVRWRPGERKTVQLVAYSGRRVVRGFNRLTDGLASPERLAEGLERARQRGYADRPSAANGGQ